MIYKRLFNIGLFIAFLFCYVDWGHDGSEFIFQMQLGMFSTLKNQPEKFSSPFLLFPLIGQFCLLLATISKNVIVFRRLTIVGLLCLTIIVLLIVGFSLLTSKWTSFLSTIPYLLFTILIIITIMHRHKSYSIKQF